VFLCASSASRGRVTVAIYEDGDRRRNDDASGDTAANHTPGRNGLIKLKMK